MNDKNQIKIIVQNFCTCAILMLLSGGVFIWIGKLEMGRIVIVGGIIFICVAAFIGIKYLKDSKDDKESEDNKGK